jgi:NAD(P)-dependent dehydrogenase (short-subunit alcohol dehydrogenase family)
MTLSSKPIAIVTGASRGAGRGIASATDGDQVTT